MHYLFLTYGPSSWNRYPLSSVFRSYSPPLHDNQWQLEVKTWMAISNAWLQRLLLMNTVGPTEAEVVPYWQLMSDNRTAALVDNSAAYAIDLELCHNQKIRSTAFSVLGLALNFILGGILMLAGFVLRYIIPLMQNRRTMPTEKEHNRRQAWTVDANLQLQCIDYQELGLGDWEGGDEFVL